MNIETFIREYARKSKMTEAWVVNHLKVLPCACGQPGCAGWAMVSNNPESIKAHMDLYAPKGRQNS